MSSLSNNYGYVTTDDQGQPVSFRDDHTSASVYSFDTETLTTNPRMKFSYFIRFIKNNNSATSKLVSQSSANSSNPLASLESLVGTAANLSQNSSFQLGASIGVPMLNRFLGIKSPQHGFSSGYSTGDWSQSVGFYATQCDRPKIKFRTRTLNQYNKKRVIQSGHDFAPVSITFNDTADGSAENMFREYYSFYYGDVKNTSTNGWIYDQEASQFNNGAGGWGFRTPSVVNSDMANFFDSMQIYIFYNGYFDRYDLVNPKISEYLPSDLDYSDASGIQQTRITLEYEGLVFAQKRQKVVQNTSLIPTFGFDRASYYYPQESVNSLGFSWTPSISFNNPSEDNQSGLNQIFSLNGLSSIASNFLGGNQNMIHSYEGIFPRGSVIGDVISQNRGTITQAIGDNNNPTVRAIANITGIF